MPPKPFTAQSKEFQAALNAVLQYLAPAANPPTPLADPFIIAAGKRIALDIRTLPSNRTPKPHQLRPRLRFDRVVVWLLNHLRTALDGIVPDGTTIFVTCTAPIRLPSKTAAAIEEKVRRLLSAESPVRDRSLALHGNQVHIRIANHGSPRAPKFIGFVHNPESAPRPLLNLAEAFLLLLAAEPRNQAGAAVEPHWLVVTGRVPSSWSEACRAVYAQLPNDTRRTRAVIVFSDGRAASLSAAP